MTCRSYDATGYSALAKCEAFDAAVVLATSAQTKQLQILLQRHAYVVSSRILHVLDCLPETLGSQQIADLLALVSNLHLLPVRLQIGVEQRHPHLLPVVASTCELPLPAGAVPPPAPSACHAEHALPQCKALPHQQGPAGWSGAACSGLSSATLSSVIV